MHVLSNYDYKLFTQLVSLSQKGMYKSMRKFLESKYDKIIAKKEYLVAVGDIPIALVAHMDTVYKYPVSEIYYDRDKTVIWSPDGLGADDRAGIFAIIKILQSCLRPSVILTTDEEIGGVGASELAKKECPIPNLKYMIELDRQGEDDCVFYDCYCPEFFDYIENFGFKTQIGSFSDISFLMGVWNICGVNLSIGYKYEHSESEMLNTTHLYETIEKVKTMLIAENIPTFKYDELPRSNYGKLWNNWNGYNWNNFTCNGCNTDHPDYELFPVKGEYGILEYYCPDCVSDYVGWCSKCGKMFKLNKEESPANQHLCKECYDKVCMTISKNSLNQ